LALLALVDPEADPDVRYQGALIVAQFMLDVKWIRQSVVEIPEHFNV